MWLKPSITGVEKTKKQNDSTFSKTLRGTKILILLKVGSPYKVKNWSVTHKYVASILLVFNDRIYLVVSG